jgi:hypothetical protein
MNEAQARLHELRDEALPLLPAMLGPAAADMLQAAFCQEDGEVVSARPAQVTWQPGRSLAVRYDAAISRLGGRGHDQASVVACTGEDLPSGATVLEAAGEHAALWRVQDDPRLPGLRTALDPDRARALLSDLRVRPGPVRVRLRAYRPGRRAVVEMAVKRTDLFVKLVQPGRVEALQARHRAIAEHLPAPRSHGWSEEHGLIVLEAKAGLTLRACLRGVSRLPEPAALAAVLECIPDLGDGHVAQCPLGTAQGHLRTLARLMPDLSGQLAGIAESLRAEVEPEPLVPVHGDFYEAQVLVAAGRISGVLDLDTVGLGHRSDDWATMLGHLAVLQGALPPAAGRRCAEYARRIVALADSQADPVILRLKVAAVIVGLATGPFRVQTQAWPAETRARLALAERWVDSATSLHSSASRLQAVAI